MSRDAQKGTVYLVGAGPGDPDLLTVRAARLLATADVVLHDDLVPDAVVALANAHALITSVGKRCGRPRITQAGIHDLMIDSARRNLSVVRLKSGDPLVFGRAAEELNALRQAGIPAEVVPGVSAVFAAGAALQLPLTDRRTASKLILIAGQHAADKSAPPPMWDGPLPADATLAIYMPGRDLAALAAELHRNGVAADMPCVAISKAATPQQRADASTLQDFGDLKPGAAPLLILVGRAMAPMLRNATDGQAESMVQSAAEAFSNLEQ
ncbi:uroporphyrinogen-III C-methyltransferase [Terriglobus roseus DSM 18391]|uniref:uroporphyrinogen-III C-methyltransferase n=1 Tax=Terriglobus roseus (strain DSM 18391 / NRRL B-41598 / KBS 63) TaxID=926566 RepID=I3ZFE0_TERRK|nr:uroporphyrinogen-III C-methyltransferase [Terriglobus roseus]AFL87958.1 uroporphyrinogen-III C-methyltransferase [Terriglobus roseus DSM 18391]